MTGETELRRTSDSFLKQVERLHELEEQKRLATPGTPEMLRLTHLVEGLASEVLGTASRQTDLAELAARRQPVNPRPIELVPPRSIPEIIAEWREAERAFDTEEPGSPRWETCRADVERLRSEYRRAYDERREEG
jgi:hypothetical protein